MKKYDKWMIFGQITLVALSGVLAGEAWYVTAISIVGVLFNFLVSAGQPSGFLFGFVYAVTNGMLSYHTKVYATFIFLVFLQAPMAVYSYFSWRKKRKSQAAIMKTMSLKKIVFLMIFMISLGAIMYGILSKQPSAAILVDDIFFVFSVTACILLALCYKNAYIITLLSGMGGTALWIYQMIHTGNGISIAVFYMIVTANSVYAIYQQYRKCRLVG